MNDSPMDDRGNRCVGAPIRIGRALDNDVVVPDNRASRHHLDLHRDGDGWWVRDLSSENGTVLNGQSVQTARARVGDVLSIGSTRLRVSTFGVEFDDGDSAIPDTPPTMAATAGPSTIPPYRPGDVVNGHRLSTDGSRWEPLTCGPRQRDEVSGRSVMPVMVRCRSCGREVAQRLERCPACSTPVPTQQPKGFARIDSDEEAARLERDGFDVKTRKRASVSDPDRQEGPNPWLALAALVGLTVAAWAGLSFAADSVEVTDTSNASKAEAGGGGDIDLSALSPGTYLVPEEVPPGRYRTVEELQPDDGLCYMSQKAGNDIVNNALDDVGRPVFEVEDVAGSKFEIDSDCGIVEQIPSGPPSGSSTNSESASGSFDDSAQWPDGSPSFWGEEYGYTAESYWAVWPFFSVNTDTLCPIVREQGPNTVMDDVAEAHVRIGMNEWEAYDYGYTAAHLALEHCPDSRANVQ